MTHSPVKPKLCLALPSSVPDREQYWQFGIQTHSPRSYSELSSNCNSNSFLPLPTKALPLSTKTQSVNLCRAPPSRGYTTESEAIQLCLTIACSSDAGLPNLQLPRQATSQTPSPPGSCPNSILKHLPPPTQSRCWLPGPLHNTLFFPPSDN